MIAFRKAMRSIEEDLKEMRQQINISKKTTKDASDEEAVWTIQKQLAFFRDESVILSQKLRESDALIKELKLKNQQLDFDARSEHKLLVKSQKELRSLKNLIQRHGLHDIGNNHTSSEDYVMTNRSPNDRSKSPNTNSRGGNGLKRIVESKYKRENIHINILRQHLEETLKRNASYLSLDKIDELVDMVADRVNQKMLAQEQQIDTLQTKLLKIKQYYQHVVRRDTGTNLPSGLHDILFIFWDMFSSFRVKANSNNSPSKSSRRSSITRSKSPNFNNLTNSPYASFNTLDKVDRSSVMNSIKSSNTRYSLFTNEDKIKLIQKTLEDPAVEAVLTYHTDAHKFIRREGRSPVEQLMRIRDHSALGSATGSRAQTPIADPIDSDDESAGNYQETLRDRDHDYLWNNSRPTTGNRHGRNRQMLAHTENFNDDMKAFSPVSGMEYSSLPYKSAQEGTYTLRLESHLSSMVLPPIEDYGSHDEMTQPTKEDEIIDSQRGEIVPQEPIEGGGGRDFRRKYQTRQSKNASINEG